ncbi:MAG: hypothetical protein JRF15_02205 [Deltaproteobacteria bacterium]|jgi:hypothetical protein|nr:hypothetical protein [Deltaproteobacteria bacterium]
MNTQLFHITLSVLLLAPLGATAQVDAGEDVVLQCESEDGAEYTLNGTAPTGDNIVNEWTTDPNVDLENADTLTPTGIFAPGVTTATLTSTEEGSDPESDSVTVTVEDTEPPVVRVKHEPFYLWPPNHSMQNVEVQVRVRDRCTGEGDYEVELIEVSSNEPDNGRGDGNTNDDIQGADIGSDDRSVMLRAERAGGGNGRVYTLTYLVTDQSGNETQAEAKVHVPHDASDLKDLIGDDDPDLDDMDPICPRPLDAVAELTDMHPGLGSVRTERACNNVCKAWAKSCDQIAKGTAKCVQGEEKALAIIGVAECKDSDVRRGIRDCIDEVKRESQQKKDDLRAEADEARAFCARQQQRCENACDDLFGAVTLPVED